MLSIPVNEPSKTINVPFHGSDLYVVNYNGEPYVPMKPIVDGMGLAWQSQFEKLKQRFKSTITEIVIVAADGKKREMICIALRKLAGWLATISPNKVKASIREKVIRYQDECDDVLYEYWTTGEVKAKTTTQSRTPLRGLVNIIMGKYGLNSKKLFQMVHHEFGVNSINELTNDQLPSAIEYLATKAIEGEFLGKETLPAPEVKQQISDEDLQTLCWGWRFLARSIEHMANVYPVLKSAEHELAPIYCEIPREGAEIEKMVRKILENVTSHIEVTPTQDNNWNILNKLRTPNYH